MRRLTAPRLTIVAYALGGLAMGIAFSVWHFGDKLASFYRHPDGSVSRSPVWTPKRTDAATGDATRISVARGRRLTRAKQVRIGASEALPILAASALVGAAWGFVRLRVRAALAPAGQNQHFLDYNDSPNGNGPRPRPTGDGAGSLS